MQNNNFNNSSHKIDYISFLEIRTNVLGKSIFKDFVKGVRNRESQLLEKWSNLENNELNYEQFKKDITKKIEEMNLVFKENSNFKDFALQEKMHGLMQETTKILDDFEKEINRIESLQKQTNEININSNESSSYDVSVDELKLDIKPSNNDINNNDINLQNNNLMQIDDEDNNSLKGELIKHEDVKLNNSSDENSSYNVNVEELKPVIKPSNDDENLQNNNLMQIDDEDNNNLKDELIIPKCNNVALNNLNEKIKLYINGFLISKVKNLLEICDRYLEKFKDEEYLINLLRKYVNKIKKNKNKDVTIPCLFRDSKYIGQYRYILRLIRKNSKIHDKNKFKNEQNKLRIIEYFYYILCAKGWVNQHGRITNENASKDFESLTDFLEQSYLK